MIEIFIGVALLGLGFLLYKKAKKSNRPVSKGDGARPPRDDQHRGA